MKDIKYSKGTAQDNVTLYSGSFKGYKVTTLSKPDRIVIDMSNNKSKLKGSGTIKVNGAIIKSIRYSQLTKRTTRVVLM